MNDTTGSPDPPGSAQVPDLDVRIAGRLSLGFLLDLTETTPDESLLDVMLIGAIAEANLNRLTRDPQLQATYARLDTPAPDGLRRPISINALSVSLQQPFETVRRRVKRLVERGVCASGPAGVYVPADLLAQERYATSAQERYDLFWSLWRDAQRLGIIERSNLTPPAADDPAAPILGVARIVSDYSLRCYEHLRLQVEDPFRGLVFLCIVRANWEPLFSEVNPRELPNRSRPVRMAELSRRMRLPYETTRRQVSWLIEAGYCLRGREGLQISPTVLFDPKFHRTMNANLTNMRRMFRQATLLTWPGQGTADAYWRP